MFASKSIIYPSTSRLDIGVQVLSKYEALLIPALLKSVTRTTPSSYLITYAS